MNPVIKYAAAALLLLVSFSSYSGVYPTTTAAYDACQSSLAPQQWCTSNDSNNPNYFHIQRQTSFTVYDSYEVYCSNSDCFYPPPVSCPFAGTRKYITSQPDQIPPSPINYDGCEYDFLLDDSSTSCAVVDSGQTLCTFTYSSTGDESSSPAFIPSSASDSFEPVDGLTDTVKSFLNSNTSVGSPSSMPDGTVTQTNTTTEIKTQDSGTKISDDDSFLTIESSDGTVTTYTETETIVTNPDGSSTVTSNISSNVKTPKVDVTSLDKGTGVISNSSGTSTIIRNGDVTTINNYNSTGQLISSEVLSQGTGTSTGFDDETKEGNCGAPGQPVCEVTIKDNSSEYQAELDKLNAASNEFEETKNSILDEFNDAIDSAFDSISYLNPANFLAKYFGYNLPSTCSGAIDTTIFGRPFYLSPCEKLQPIRDILAWSFFILTLLLCSKILFSRSPL